MVREIEFRAWLKYQKEMVGVTTIDFKKGYVLIDKPYFPKIPEYYGTALLFDQIELMQYTGLKDKNGVKIFEGDIVKAVGYPAIDVIYDKESCSFKMKVQYIGWEDLLILSSNKTPHLEIIGNIYENKELLENA